MAGDCSFPEQCDRTWPGDIAGFDVLASTYGRIHADSLPPKMSVPNGLPSWNLGAMTRSSIAGRLSSKRALGPHADVTGERVPMLVNDRVHEPKGNLSRWSDPRPTTHGESVPFPQVPEARCAPDRQLRHILALGEWRK